MDKCAQEEREAVLHEMMGGLTKTRCLPNTQIIALLPFSMRTMMVLNLKVDIGDLRFNKIGKSKRFKSER